MQRWMTAVCLALLLALALPLSPVRAQAPTSPASAAASAESTAEPSLDDLITILENEDTRAKLVQSLKAAAYQAPAEGEAEAASEEPAIQQTLPGQIAAAVTSFIGSAIETGQDVWTSFDGALDTLTGASRLNLPNIIEAVLPVGLVAIVVFVVLGLGRLVKAPIFRRLSRSTEHASPLTKLLLLATSGLVDALSILLSWSAGVLAAAIFFRGQPGINQQLFLNAFLVIEMIKVALSVFVAPNYPALRLTPFSNRQASYWYFWFSRLISILGYTFLFAAPVIQRASSWAAADAVRFMVVTFTVILAISLILRNRGTVRERLKRAHKQGDGSIGARVNAFVGQIWWVIAIGFVVSVFVVWLRSPEAGLQFLTAATLKSIAAMAVGGLIVSVLTRWIASGIPIPASTREKLPLLEKRVNSFIPNALTVLRVVAVVAVLAYILEAWSLINYSNWLATDAGQRFVGGLIGAGIVLCVGVAIYIAVSSWVEYRLNPNFGTVPTARERTLLSLFRNAFTITMVVVVTMLVLSQVGIDIAPLLAGAGVVGLAVGFGAQKFVQDIITGAFIQIQNAMNEGDIVEVNGVSGTVEQLTVRSVAIRSLDGTWYLIPFSSVDQVANFSKDFAYYVADLGVAYRENVEDVKQLMLDAFAEMKTGPVAENLLSDMDMWGVNELGDSAVVVRARVMTKPGTQWGVGRAYREIVKRLADERGIEIPFPHMTVWFGEDRKGKAPPIHITRDAAESAAPAIEAQPARTDGRGAATEGPKASVQDGYGTHDAQGRPIPPDEGDIDSAGGGRG